MKNFLAPLITTIGAKQMTVVVALITTAFVVVQASSTSRNASAGIDVDADLANSAITGNESLAPIAGSEPAPKSSSALATAASSSGASEHARPAPTDVTFGGHASGLPTSSSNRLLPAESGLFASTRQTTPGALAANSVGTPANFTAPSGGSSLNGTSGGSAGSGAMGGSGGSSDFNGSSAAADAAANTTRTDSLASSILESPVASTALLNTDSQPAPSAVGDIDLSETSSNPASNPLDFSSALEDSTLDLMAMKIADLEPSVHSALASEDDDITPVAAVPDAGHTLWLLSAAMAGLLAYGQRSSSRRHATK